MRSVLTEDDKKLLAARRVKVTGEALAAPSEPEPDDYTSQIAKNIPIEVVSFYTGVFALVEANKTDPIDPAVATVANIMFGIAFLGTILYSWMKNTKDNVPNVPIKVGMATIAFVLWAYTIWWPLGTYIPQNTFVGGALVLAYLFASPAVYECITLIQTRYLKPKQKLETPSHPTP
jgi:hypothetical protein